MELLHSIELEYLVYTSPAYQKTNAYEMQNSPLNINVFNFTPVAERSRNTLPFVLMTKRGGSMFTAIT